MIYLQKQRGAIAPRPFYTIFIAALIVFCCGCLLFLCLGVNPLSAYIAMFRGSFGSWQSFSEVLVKATPLIFTGLAVAVAGEMMLWNIGAEGQLIWGRHFCSRNRTVSFS